MSDTIVDLPKVTQMLDAGWDVNICKNQLGSYSVRAHHNNADLCKRIASKLEAAHNAIPDVPVKYSWGFDWDKPKVLLTDDFTPEQALTRMAYKVFGEII